MMTSKKTIKGLYVITPDLLDTQDLLNRAQAALSGGAAVLQYRNKLADAALRLEQAQALRELTHNKKVTFIINDHLELAQQVDADGLHLGGDDGSIKSARETLGPDKIIGASCYNRIDLAEQALQDGASYIAFGAFFSSSVKPNAPVATLELLKQARQLYAAPIVCIGGITLNNATTLFNAGADALAVISAVFSAANIQQTATQFAALTSSDQPI